MAATFVGTRIQHGGKILYLSVSGSLGRDRVFISGTGVCRYGVAGIGLGLLFRCADPDLCAAVSVDDGRSRQKKQTVCVSSEDPGTAGKNNRRYFLCFFVALSVLFLGILTESYAGSGLVQMILRIVY